MVVSKPLPPKYWDAIKAEGVKLTIPAVISAGVFRFIARSNVLGANASETTEKTYKTQIEDLKDEIKSLKNDLRELDSEGRKIPLGPLKN